MIECHRQTDRQTTAIFWEYFIYISVNMARSETFGGTFQDDCSLFGQKYVKPCSLFKLDTADYVFTLEIPQETDLFPPINPEKRMFRNAFTLSGILYFLAHLCLYICQRSKGQITGVCSK